MLPAPEGYWTQLGDAAVTVLLFDVAPVVEYCIFKRRVAGFDNFLQPDGSWIINGELTAMKFRSITGTNEGGQKAFFTQSAPGVPVYAIKAKSAGDESQWTECVLLRDYNLGHLEQFSRLRR